MLLADARSLAMGVTSGQWFTDTMGGYTTEYVFMFIAGYAVCHLICAYVEDIYGSQALIMEKEKDSLTDELTGLWKRKYLRHYFEQVVIDEHQKGALVIIDLDNFKHINDMYGHPEGDRVLQIFAMSMNETLRADYGDILCRVGGDEFVVFLHDVESEGGILWKVQS